MRITGLRTLVLLLSLIGIVTIFSPCTALTDQVTSNRQDVNEAPEIIDLRGKALTLEQLKGIWEEVNNNNMLGHVLWGTLPEGSDELKKRIENKVIENNKSYRRYPNDFIHALLSSHVYKDTKVGSVVEFDSKERNSKLNQYLAGWKVYKIYAYPDYGGYYAVVYINNEQKQLVLAHRGTIVQLKDLITRDSALKTDLKGILGREIVAQQAAAYKATKEIVEDAKKIRYNLSTTGHSLGAWLAELSLYFCYRDFEYLDVKAITFDSPGSVIHIDKLKPNIINNVTKFDIRDLNIVTYLSAPNFVNSCNQHVGRVYRLFPKITKPGTVEKVTGWFNLLGNKLGIVGRSDYSIEGLWSIFGHSLDGMIATFDPDSGKPLRYYEVIDWPVVKYTPKLAKGKTLLNTLFDSASASLIPDVLIKIKDSVQDNTILTFLTIISEVANGNIDQEQYLNYFKHIEDDSSVDLGKDGYDIKKQLSDNEQFSLNYEGHYRVSNLSKDMPDQDILSTDQERSVDWYLNELKKRRGNQLGTELTRRQLAELSKQYVIIRNNKNIIESSTTTIELIREIMIRLLHVNSEVKKILDNSSNQNIQGETTFSTFLPVRSDLIIPIEKAFLERPEIVKKINDQLNKNNDSGIQAIELTAIVGIGGAGKTTIARYFARTATDASIVWELNVETKETLINSFRDLTYAMANTPKLKKEINFLLQVQEPEAREKLMLNFIKNHLKTISNWLLIYDNMESFLGINHLFPHDYKQWGNGKVIITTRNEHIMETSYIRPENMVYIDQLSEGEILTLFSKILYDVEPDKLGQADRDKAIYFLKNIPPFPLDVSVAAYSIKNTHITFEQYLKQIEKYRQNYDLTESRMIKESTDYSKTRYGIIASAIEKISKENIFFKELFFFICLLDSQNIPNKLLENYRNNSLIDSFLYTLRQNGLLLRESSSDYNKEDKTISVHRSTKKMALHF